MMTQQGFGSVEVMELDSMELSHRIECLQRQLRSALDELEQRRKSNIDVKDVASEDKSRSSFGDGDHFEETNDQPLPNAPGTALPAPHGLIFGRNLSSITVASPNPPVTKRGYLFKWLDRSIGWTGTKWALRFVVLEQGKLAYYGSHTDTSPRYVLSLRGCAVRDEGWKRNRRYIQSPFNISKSSSPKRNKVRGKDDHIQEGMHPSFDEPGAYFFLFSVYHRPHDQGDDDIDDDNENVVPLLKFSTPSMAERNLWIQLIDESCSFCETDEYLLQEAMHAAEVDRQLAEQKRMALAMPEAKEGTLPPLFFAPPTMVNTALSKMHRSRPSFHKIPSQSNLNRSRSKPSLSNKNLDADAADRKSTKGYPPSKPMHRASAPSYLSFEAPIQNYRGFFNVGVILLLLSNIKMIQASLKTHGVILLQHLNPTEIILYLYHIPTTLYSHPTPWIEFPLLTGFSFQFVFVLIAYVIEYGLSRGLISETIGMTLHHINAHSALVIPLVVVWNVIDEPPIGLIILLHATTTWMKLTSYFLANQDYRLSTQQQQPSDVATTALLGLVENLDDAETNTTYPQNVTVRDILYFWCAPTLTYQIAFPKSKRIRLWFIGDTLARMFVIFTLFTFGASQIVGPVLQSLVQDLERTGGKYTLPLLAEYWLGLSVATTYLWFLMFYLYFHLYMDLLAEILRFGDRVFYKDWWNSSEVSAFWRLWNLPVHYWLIRHLYFPCIRLRISKGLATFVVFLVSAIMHEVLVSVPFHIVRPWSFLGMMMQIPLVAITKYLYRKDPGSSIGNIIFWLSFCVVGQPMAILLYTVDYNYAHHLHHDVNATLSSESIDTIKQEL